MAVRVALLLPCLVFLVSLSTFASVATSDDCVYTVDIKTGDVADAGTDSKISLILISSTGYSINIKNLTGEWGSMGASHDYFERNKLDFFYGRGPCLNVCAISVISDGKGYKPGWYLAYVEVARTGGQVTKFTVNKWLTVDELLLPRSLYAIVNKCSG